MPQWLGKVDFPLFLSRRRLSMVDVWRKTNRWALDSGAFTELNKYGKWTVSAQQYADEAVCYQECIGKMDFAAVQDWMCEPFILTKTGFSVLEHQKFTLESYFQLMELAPEVPWMPILQGFSLQEYENHISMYRKSGVDLEKLPIVGVGSVCRRQNTVEIAEVLRVLSGFGVRLHAFGVKMGGLVSGSKYIISSDSMAWSYCARRESRLVGCKHRGNCANCLRYAIMWRERVLSCVS